MNETNAKIIIALAQCNLNITDAANKVGRSRNGFLWRLERIKDITGLDPRNFFDLHELYSIARRVVGDNCELF